MKKFRNYLVFFKAALLILCSASSISAKEAESKVKLSLLTLNVQQFAYGIKYNDDWERALRLTDLVRAKHEEFDVLAFQELWSNVTRKFIYKKIKDLYPYRFQDNQYGVGALGFHSGLAIYSKYPIVRMGQMTYRNARSHENFAKKGVLGVELNVQGKTAYVFNTHLQAGPGGSFFRWWDRGKPTTAEISVLQLKEARAFITQFVVQPTAPIFFIGDLNISARNESEYNSGLAALLDARDTFDPTRSKIIGTSWDSFPSDHRIDYILHLGAQAEGYSFVTDYFGANVTDHLGVTGEFYF